MPSIIKPSTSKCTINNIIGKIAVGYHVELTMVDPDGVCPDQTIRIFTGNKYKISYYNADTNKMTKVTGVCIDVGKEAIVVESITAIDDKTCLCVTRKDLTGLVKMYTVGIPFANIHSIEEVIDSKPPIPKERIVTTVAIIGISTEFIKSVVVRLRIFNDGEYCKPEAIPVDMRVGCKYHVAFFSRTDHTIYEFDGTLLDIEEAPKFEGDTKLNGFVRDEVVGMNNTIYDADHFMDLNKESVDGERVRFKFDTSETFDSFTDYVWLKDIRGVSLIIDEDAGPENTCPLASTCPVINPGMKPPIHHHHHHHTDDCIDDEGCWEDLPGFLPPHDHNHHHCGTDCNSCGGACTCNKGE